MIVSRLFTTLVMGMLLVFSGCAGAGAGGSEGRRSTEADEFAKPGFYTEVRGGRLWVFQENSEEHKDFLNKGEPAKQVIRPGAGPGGMTLKAADSETITLYLAGKPGFYVAMDDGRLWVFKEGSKELEEFRTKGKPAKQVIRPGAGPGGITLKSTDSEILDSYLSAR